MKLSSNFQEVFRKDDLVQWTSGELENSGLSEDTSRFLSAVGLPSNPGLDLRFGPGRLARYATQVYFAIGDVDGVDVDVGILVNGRVMAVESGTAMRFINDSVQSLAKFLALFQAYRENAANMSEDNVLELIRLIESGMRAIDQTAFEEEESWWPLVLEQMNAGLL